MCLPWASEFSPVSCWRSNTSFVLVGVAVQHPPGESVPRSMVATCWHFSPWCLRHRESSLRFFLPELPPSLAHPTALYFWIQNLTDHMKLQSIFLLLWRSKRALFMCISVCLVLQLRSPSVITAPCRVHPVYLSVWMSAPLFITTPSCSRSALCFYVDTVRLSVLISLTSIVYIKLMFVSMFLSVSSRNSGLFSSILKKETDSFHPTDIYLKKSCCYLIPSWMPVSLVMATTNSRVCGFYQCLINAWSSTPEESVFQFCFCSSIPFLSSSTLFSLQRFLPQMIYGEHCCLWFSKAWVLWYLPAYKITKDVDWDGVMMIHLPIMLLSRSAISSSTAV